MKSTISFRVRYQETDQMGIVHHSVYLIWFEAGRTEWMREFGLTYRNCEEKGWLLPLVESGTKYHKPARYDDLVEVETTLLSCDKVLFEFEYVVRCEGEILTTGFTKHVCVDKNYKISREGTNLLKNIFCAEDR